MNKKKKHRKVIDKYTQPIFSVSNIYVCKNVTEKDLNKIFCNFDGSDIHMDTSNNELCIDACTLYNVKTRKDGYAVIVVILDEEYLRKYSDKYEQYFTICHEALHATKKILKYSDIYLTDDTEEVFAYAIGWIASCIMKTYEKK